jgi:tryptophan-rich sensory protein
MDSVAWYASLVKPSFAPPAWVFRPVWSVLYLGIIVSFGSVFLQAWRGAIPARLAVPFALNLLCNVLFTYIQMQLQSNVGAAVDIVLILATLGWALYVIYPYMPWVTYINIPYFLWVSFATILQFSITYLNWGK